MIYRNNSDPYFHNLHYCNNYLKRHSHVNIVWHQKVCHYVAPLLGRIKNKCHISIL